MKTVQGFSLIELLIAITIASSIMTLLFTTFWQTNKAVRSLDSNIDAHFKIMIMQRQLERDLAGAFVPLTVFEYEKQEKKKREKKAVVSTAAPVVEPESKLKLPKIEKIFYAVGTDAHLELVTCITNNPVPSYWRGDIGKPKPKIARVVYSIKPQTGTKKKLYSLWRQEAYNLDYAAFTGTDIRSYEIASGLKEIKATFTFYKEKKDESGKKSYEKITTSDWNKESEESLQEGPRIAQLIEFEGSIQEDKRLVPFSFAVAITTESAPVPVEQQQKPVSPTAEKPKEQNAKPEAQKAPAADAKKQLLPPGIQLPGAPAGATQPKDAPVSKVQETRGT